MAHSNGGIIVSGGVFKANQVAVGENSTAVQLSNTGGQPLQKSILDDQFLFSRYEVALERLRSLMGREHPLISDFWIYQQRLVENIEQSRRFGDDDSKRAERAQIVEQLNRLSVEVAGQFFNEL